jgi:hypothetical protein
MRIINYVSCVNSQDETRNKQEFNHRLSRKFGLLLCTHIESRRWLIRLSASSSGGRIIEHFVGSVGKNQSNELPHLLRASRVFNTGMWRKAPSRNSFRLQRYRINFSDRYLGKNFEHDDTVLQPQNFSSRKCLGYAGYVCKFSTLYVEKNLGWRPHGAHAKKFYERTKITSIGICHSKFHSQFLRYRGIRGPPYLRYLRAIILEHLARQTIEEARPLLH